MASGEDADLIKRVRERSGVDLTGMTLGASPDQEARLLEDVAQVSEHGSLAGRVVVGGFRYDVDTGVLNQLV
jgi:carbonic anhydrase